MTLLEDAAAEQTINNHEALYDSLPIAPVVIPSTGNVKEQEVLLYWRVVNECCDAGRQPITYRLMQHIAECFDDLDLVRIHTKSPALRRRCEALLRLHHEWIAYNIRPYKPNAKPAYNPVDVFFNRTGND